MYKESKRTCKPIVLLIKSLFWRRSRCRRRPQWQRERRKTNGLLSITMAVHVRYKVLWISLPSSAKQQREMTNFRVVWGTWTTTAFFLKSLFRIFAGFLIQFRESFDNEKLTKWRKSIARFEGKIQIHFCNRRCPRRSRLKVNEVWTCLSPGCSKTSDAPCSCTALNSHRNSLYQRL